MNQNANIIVVKLLEGNGKKTMQKKYGENYIL